MKEQDKTKSLSVAALIFVAIIVVGLLTTGKPDIAYKITPQQSIEALGKPGNEISPLEVAKTVKANDNKFIIIDLRSPYEFVKGNIPGSINIPANRILEKESLDFFEKNATSNSTLVLYDATQSLATGPWLVLKQLGYDNIKMMQGGWKIYSGIDSQDPSQNPAWLVEIPKYDFAALSASKETNANKGNQAGQKEIIVPQRKVKAKKVEGGC